MVKKIKDFFNIVKLEIKKVFRNKMVLTMLCGFTVLLLVLMSFVGGEYLATKNINDVPINIGINRNGAVLEESVIWKVVKEHVYDGDFIEISSKEEGINKINYGKLDLFLNINTEESPQTVTVFYDNTNIVATEIVKNLSRNNSNIIHNAMTDYLSVIGITIDEDYFNVLSYEATNKSAANLKSRVFVLVTGVSLGVIILFGLAYSMARDNETQTIKNILYMPMGVNRYLLSKTVPYLILGFIELVLSFVLGNLLYGITFQINIFVILIVSMCFIVSLICLGLLLSLMKSQMASVFVGVLLIIYPLFVNLTGLNTTLPKVLNSLTYLIPGIPYINLLNGMTFNGVIVWWQVGVLLGQALIFYALTYFLLKRKVEK